MTEAAESVAAPVRQRIVSWEDPLAGAAQARDLSGLDYLRAIAEGRIPSAPIAAGPDGTLYAHATTTCLVLEPAAGAGRQGSRPDAGLEQPPGGNGNGR